LLIFKTKEIIIILHHFRNRNMCFSF
jgi:hypothetical protein